MILKSHLLIVESSDGWRLEARRYRRNFRKPVRTARSTWNRRDGFVLRADSPEGQSGFGEIAPVPFFPGARELEESFQTLWSLDRARGSEWVGRLREDPVAAAGVSMALEATRWPRDEQAIDGQIVRSAVLVPFGPGLAEAVAKRRVEGYTVFKLKIGHGSFLEERPVIEEVLHSLGSHERLRLDANGGLTREEAERWLRFLDDFAEVDYLEEPFVESWRTENLAILGELTEQYRTRIAVDEGLSEPEARRTILENDRLILVIKPSVFGDLGTTRQLVRERPDRVILSTAFETAFGFEHLLRLAATETAGQVHGLTAGGLFQDERMDHPESGPVLYAGRVGPQNWDDRWDGLPML